MSNEEEQNQCEIKGDKITIYFDSTAGLRVVGELNIKGGGIFAEAILCVIKKAKRSAKKSGRDLTSELVSRLALSFEEHPILQGPKPDENKKDETNPQD